MKQDKMCKFPRKSSSSSYVQQYNRKQLNQLTLCQFDAWGVWTLHDSYIYGRNFEHKYLATLA